MIIEISVAVIAAVLVLLVIFLIITLVIIIKLLLTVKRQITSFDSIFRSISNVGNALEQTTLSLKEKAETNTQVENTNQRTLNRITDGIAIAALAISVWHKLKKRS